MSAADIRHWQTLTVRDPDTIMTWLGAIGFSEHLTVRNKDDPSIVLHAEWIWSGGGIMFGSVRADAVGASAPGNAACYLVAADPESMFDAAVAAGATVVRAMQEEDYGGRGGTVRDPEGNHWSFGSYQPE